MKIKKKMQHRSAFVKPGGKIEWSTKGTPSKPINLCWLSSHKLMWSGRTKSLVQLWSYLVLLQHEPLLLNMKPNRWMKEFPTSFQSRFSSLTPFKTPWISFYPPPPPSSKPNMFGHSRISWASTHRRWTPKTLHWGCLVLGCHGMSCQMQQIKGEKYTATI